MKKLGVLLFALLLVGLLATPALGLQIIGLTGFSSNINSDIGVTVGNMNGGGTGDANATGNSTATGINNGSLALAGLGIAGNNTENTVVNGGVAGAGSGSTAAGQLAGNTVLVGSSNNAGVGSIIVGP